MSWKRLSRKTIYNTKYLKVYEDKVELPNGNFHENYSVFKLPDIVYIIATDNCDNVITVDEYKYGTNDVMRGFPAGHIDENEDPVTAAKRELIEETGYGNGEFELITDVKEFQTKNLSKIFIVRAKNVEKLQDQNLDENESLEVKLVSKATLKDEIDQKKWKGSSALAAILLTNLLSA